MFWEQQTQKCSHCTLPGSKVIEHTCHYVNAFLKGDRLICLIIGKNIALLLCCWQFVLLESKSALCLMRLQRVQYEAYNNWIFPDTNCFYQDIRGLTPITEKMRMQGAVVSMGACCISPVIRPLTMHHKQRQNTHAII